jgi:predicted dehydrogenase
MTTRIGIIGANWSLKVHGTAWRALPDVEVLAVCTAHKETAEEAARLFQIPRAYWDVKELAADPNIDVIDVGSRPSYRYDMVMAALEGGKHVYDALPFALDVEQARQQAAAARDKGLTAVVDAQFRWVPAAMHMKSMIDEGFLGDVTGFSVQLLLPLRVHDAFVYPHSSYPEGGISPYKWLADSASGGSGWRNFGSHATLLLTHLVGPVAAAAGNQATGIRRWTLPDGTVLEPDTADLGCAVLKLENGAIGTMQTGWAVPDGAGLRVELWGDRGRLLLVDPTFGDGISARLYAGRPEPFQFGSAGGEWVETPDEYYAVPGMGWSKAVAPPYMVSMGWMFHDMLAAIRDKRSSSPSFEEALHAHKVVEAVVQSGQGAGWVDIGSL